MDKKHDLYSVGLTQEKLLDAFAWMYPYLAILGIALVVVFSALVGILDLAKRGLQTIGIPVILASITLLVSRRVHRRTGTNNVASPRSEESILARIPYQKRVTVTAFLTLFAVSVWLLTVSQFRPWTYFVVVLLLYVVLVVQIFGGEFDPRVVLVEVPLLMLSQIYGVTLKYAYYYGWTDVFMHVERAKITYLTGHTVPKDISAMYASFPLYHIFVSEATYVLGISMKTALFVVTVFPYVVTPILVYYFVSGGFQDDRIPALVTVFYSANTIVLFYGNYMITRTMAFVGFVFLLYFVYKKVRRNTATFTGLLVLMAYFTTTVHQVSMPQIIVLLLVLYFWKRFLGVERFLRGRTILLVTVIFLSYWILFAWDFVMTLVDMYTRSEHYDEVEIMSLGSEQAEKGPLVELVRRIRYLLQNYVVVFYSILGIGAGLYERHTKYARTLLLFALVVLGLFVPSPLRLIGQAMDLFRFDRLELLVSPFVATAMGVGVVSLLRSVNQHRRQVLRWTGTALAFLLVVAYVFTSVTHPLVASDAEELPWSESRNHFTETEIEGFDFVLREVSSGSVVRGDAHTAKFFNRRAYDGHDRLYERTYDSTLIFNVSNVSKYEGYTVFRSEKFRNGGLKLSFAGSKLFPTEEATQILRREFHRKDKIFSNGDVEIYHTNESSSRGGPR